MTWVLGIDTSHYVAAGLAHEGQPVDAIVVPDTRAHLEELMPSVQELLRRNDLDMGQLRAVAVGMGPGPFTGLRVGIAAAETLAASLQLELHRVCSLDVLAAQWDTTPREFVVASDARRKELYWARYVEGRRVDSPQVSPPSRLPMLPVIGAVPEEYRQLIHWQATGPEHLDPALLAARADTLPAASDEPYYLRPADATVGGAPKSALPRLRARR